VSKRARRLLVAACALALLALPAGPPARSGSSAHRVALPWVASAEQYAFFVGGHPRALTSSSPPGMYPPFVAAFPRIRAHTPALGVLTGDIVYSGTPANWDAVDTELAQLGVPVRFAVGNHDMSNRALFVARYGPTYYAFAPPQAPRDLFIVLDTELSAEGIAGDQLAFLRDTLARSQAQRAFVFMHKLLWVCKDTPYEVLYSRLNNPSAYNLEGNFWRAVAPLLRGFGKPVYVFAGDVGITWALALFYQEDGNLRLVASGVGGSSEESYLSVEVSGEQVRLRAYRLDGQPLARERLEEYNLDYYRGS
jgi:hypothetical protein